MTGQAKKKLLDDLPFFDPSKRNATFDEARCAIRKMKLQSPTEYRNAIRDGKMDGLEFRIPVNPQDVYTEWTGWDDYLGTGGRVSWSNFISEYRKNWGKPHAALCSW